jgi:molybdopterin biosynthesis enzyme MoaB
VTPEATRAVIEREAPGIAERIRVSAMDKFPRAALSRGLAGARHRTLIVNLPGSPSGVNDALVALDPIVEHAVAILRGEETDHTRGVRPQPEGRPPASRPPASLAPAAQESQAPAR